MKPRVRFDSNRREDPYVPSAARTRKGGVLSNATDCGEDFFERCWANEVYVSLYW